MIQAKKSSNFGKLTINGEEYDIYIAKSKEQKERGLRGVLNLNKDEGMFFIIDENEPQETIFNTIGMNFPIDMLFLDDEFNILDIKRAQAPGKDQIKGIASYVVELAANSGISENADIDLDDEESHKYTMAILGSDNKPQAWLESGERIVSRRETLVLIKKALKAYESKEDKDYKALGKYIFKVLKGQDSRNPEYVASPKGKEKE